MPKIEIEATELTEADAQYVSLVMRGANKVPFRYTKEKAMNLNLQTMFQKATARPAVCAILVAKTADLETVKLKIKAAGYSVDEMVEKEDAIFFNQEVDGGYDEDAVVAVKYDDDIAVLLCNVAKGFVGANFESTSFKEMLSQEGVYPGIRMAKDVLGYTIDNILYESDDASTAASLVEKAVADFGKYVSGLVQAVPVSAFKFDGPEAKALVEKAVAERGGSDPDPADPALATMDDSTPAEVDPPADPEDDKDPPADPAEVEDDSVANALKAMADGIAALGDRVTDGLGKVAKDVEVLSTGQAKINERLDGVETLAKSAEEAVSGIVGGDADDDRMHQKAGAGTSFALIDTAHGRPPPLN